MLKAFILTDDYTAILFDDQGEETVIGRLLPGLQEVIAEEFGQAVPEVDKVVDEVADEPIEACLIDEDIDFEGVADLELLGEDGDPGDRILPEEFIRSGDPVEDEGLTPLDAEELIPTGVLSQVAAPQDLYVAYFVNIQRSAENPWGSRDSFAGIDAIAAAGSSLRSLPYFFQVVAVLPRQPRGEFRNFIGRDGRVHTVQMKDRPYVVVRAGDIDENGNFVPGIVDEETSERRERYFVIAAWSLYNIRTGERFQYTEPTAPVRLNEEFRRRVFQVCCERYPHLFQKVLHPRKHLGVKYWRVEVPTEGDGEAYVSFRFWDGRYTREVVQVSGSQPVLPAAPISQLRLFALQAVAWRLVEQELAGGKEVSE